MRRNAAWLASLSLAFVFAITGCSDTMLAPAPDLGPAIHGVISSLTSTTVFVDGSNGSTAPDACGLSGRFTLWSSTVVLRGGSASSAAQLAIGQTVDAYPTGAVAVSCPEQAQAGRIVIAN